jgi:hypothetical protein
MKCKEYMIKRSVSQESYEYCVHPIGAGKWHPDTRFEVGFFLMYSTSHCLSKSSVVASLYNVIKYKLVELAAVCM